MNKKRLIALFLSFTMIIGSLPMTVLADETEDLQEDAQDVQEASDLFNTPDTVTDPIDYIECSWTGTRVDSTRQWKEEVQTVPSDGSMTSGWYYLNSNVSVDGRINLTGDTYLILGDGFTLDVKGIFIPQNSTLTIYAQSNGNTAGKIYSHPDGGGAAIGGKSKSNNGSVEIHGGTIIADGDGHCAGIGTNDGKTGGSITIYGGTVTAKGGSDGAGIGGGRNCDGGTIVIYGGTINANEDPNENGAAIGGGDCGDGGNITIYGGTINCWSRDGACIGGGDDGDGGTITINGGTIKCWDAGHAQGARIGGGCDGDGGITTITGGIIDCWSRDGAGIGGGEDGDGGIIRISGGTITTHPQGQGNGAGIGGGNHSGAGGNITITGGVVTAESKHGAGIGGGRAADTGYFSSLDNSGSGGTVTISGGTVNAVSFWAYGIGAGGSYKERGTQFSSLAAEIGSAGTITITGGTVTAKGYLAGIGGDSGNIKISGGTATVSGYDNDDGYGIHLLSDNGKVTISGGTVNAYGIAYCAGISCERGTVTIKGGTVNAFAGRGAGIGTAKDDGTVHTPAGRNNTDEGRDVKPRGTLIIEGENTEVHATSWYNGIGGFSCGNSGYWYFRNGATIEITITKSIDAGDTERNFYDGARITAGSSSENAVPLRAEKRETAYANYKYRLIEPCDHEGTVEEGVCWACGRKFSSFDVTYELGENEILFVERVDVGAKAHQPEEPVRDGFVFQGWYEVLPGGILGDDSYDFDDAVTNNITLRAVWNHEHDGIIFRPWDSDSGLPGEEGSYVLTKDVTLSSGWTWNEGTLNLCLNGHTITGNINRDDSVISVNGGTLNLYDEEGAMVTQVDARAATVFIGDEGTLNMYGGTITGAMNAYSDPLSGIEVYGSFHMSGGIVTGNPKGVLVEGIGTFTVSGNACVTGNAYNVLLTNNKTILIGGAFDEDARIGVTMDQPSVFTDGLNGNGTEANFLSDNNRYAVVIIDAGEAMLTDSLTVTFDKGDDGAVGTMDPEPVPSGREYTLPACGFTAPEGKVFIGWTIGNGTEIKHAGDEIRVTADITLTAQYDSFATLKGYKLSLDGDIGVNFYMEVADTPANEDLYMRFTVPGASSEYALQEVYLNETVPQTIGGHTYRVFKCRVAAKEMTATITAQLYNGESEASEAYTYSVQEYAEYILDHASQSEEYSKAAPLVKAMLNYGSAAQIYFGVNIYDLANSIMTESDRTVAPVAQADITAPAAVIPDLPEGVEFAGATVSLKSETTLSLYFTSDQTLTFSCEDHSVETHGSSDTYQIARIRGISADDMDEPVTLTVTCGENSYIVQYSILNYCRNALDGTHENLEPIITALYRYYEAAEDYAGE